MSASNDPPANNGTDNTTQGQGVINQASVPVPDASQVNSVNVEHAPSSSSDHHAEVLPTPVVAAGAEAEVAALVEGEKQYTMTFKWGTKPPFEITIWDSDTVGDIKACLYSMTEVPPDRQKIIGLVKGKLPSDEIAVSTLNLAAKVGAKFVLIGTPEGEEARDPNSSPDVANTVDIDYSRAAAVPAPPPVAAAAGPSKHKKEKEKLVAGQGKVPTDSELDDPRTNARNRRKVLEMATSLEINIMNERRPGKKLLVLDLDYTLFDCKDFGTGSIDALSKARPGLEAFMTRVYQHYDIVIWSQTHWRWLETKITELGMVQNPAYSICFVLDKTCMFSIYSKRSEGKIRKHEVKALEIIWRKMPGWDATNSVHIDDLGRNFAMNPGEGVKIEAFQDARRHQGDRELFHLANYLVDIAENKSDFTTVDHAKWMEHRKTSSMAGPSSAASSSKTFDAAMAVAPSGSEALSTTTTTTTTGHSDVAASTPSLVTTAEPAASASSTLTTAIVEDATPQQASTSSSSTATTIVEDISSVGAEQNPTVAIVEDAPVTAPPASSTSEDAAMEHAPSVLAVENDRAAKLGASPSADTIKEDAPETKPTSPDDDHPMQ